ncbi:MAG: hypothetical protein Kow0069_24590 [Promethearchaeota archaeon]
MRGDQFYLGMTLPQSLVELIDSAVSRDFEIHPVAPEDEAVDSFRALKFTLEFNGIEVLYCRRVVSPNTPVVPREQYLFGFRPKDGLCLLTTKHEHKRVLCDGPFLEDCLLMNSLSYLLVQKDQFKVWSYIPPCVGCSEVDCKNRDVGIELRTKLYVYTH